MSFLPDNLTTLFDLSNLHRYIIQYLMLHAALHILYVAGRVWFRVYKRYIWTDADRELFAYYSAHPFKKKS